MLVLRVEDESERSFEPVGHFMLVRAERLVRFDDREHGRDDIAGDRSIGIHLSDDFCGLRLKAEFFPCLPQRRRDDTLTGIDTSARECDLARMRAHMFSPDGQDHAGLLAPGHSDQDRRRNVGQRIFFRKITFQGRHGRRSQQRLAKLVGETHPPWSPHSGKKAPRLQTPGGSFPSSSAISASS